MDPHSKTDPHHTKPNFWSETHVLQNYTKLLNWNMLFVKQTKNFEHKLSQKLHLWSKINYLQNDKKLLNRDTCFAKQNKLLKPFFAGAGADEKSIGSRTLVEIRHLIIRECEVVCKYLLNYEGAKFNKKTFTVQKKQDDK